MDEFTYTRGNSAGPSIDANAVAPKPNVKATVTLMNMTERRINALVGNNENWMLTTYSLVETDFPCKGEAVNEKCCVDVQQFSFSEQPVSKSEGHRELGNVGNLRQGLECLNSKRSM